METVRVFAWLCAVLPVVITLPGCGDGHAEQVGMATALPPFVKTVPVTPGVMAPLGLSGVVRARVESPLAFQVGGRLATRQINAGQQVKTGQVLFELDKRDLEQDVLAAKANLEAADSALASTQADLARHRQLALKHFISTQAVQSSELALREAQTRREVALAHLGQARNALGYGQLRAPAEGVLMEVSAEAGQVVGAGQAVAILAQAGEREVEVHFPEQVNPPPRGELLQAQGNLTLHLREQAGAVDPRGRTLRARYSVQEVAPALLLGAVVRTRFTLPPIPGEAGVRVPLSALNERGAGAQVWLFRQGQVTAVAVTVLALDSDEARVSGPLQVGDHIVALGTHLLSEHMSVRELEP